MPSSSPSFAIGAIVIFPLAFSPRKPIYRQRRRYVVLSALVLLALLTASAQAQQVDITLDSIEHTAFSANGIKVSIDVLHPGEADIAIAELLLGTSDKNSAKKPQARSAQNAIDNAPHATAFRDLRLHCDQFHLDAEIVRCGAGNLRRGKRPPLAFTFAYRFANGKLDLTLKDADVAAWSTFVNGLRQFNPVGKFDLTLDADRDQAKFNFVVRGLGFNTADYGIAGEKIGAVLSVKANRSKDDWHWQAAMDWSEGEAFWAPWYRKAGVHLTGDGSLTAAQLQVDQARLVLDGLGSLTAGLSFDRKLSEVTRWGFVTDPIDLSAAVREWVKPVLEARALPTFTATGTTRYAAEWSNGALQSFYAGIENATFKESSGRLALSGVNASVPWSNKENTQAEISIGGGALNEFTLGAFRVPVRLHGFDVAIAETVIPFLDGRIRIDDFHAWRPKVDWIGRFSGGIEGVTMPTLTAAMGLPLMAGKLNMRIPAAEYADRVLNLNGDMGIDVFDGRITIRNLKLIDPLSKTSRFLTDVEARGLDLGLLTSTFSFGSIIGRLDADIVGLELQNWKPLAFKAHLADSPGDYRRAISRGALIDISALGGAAGAAAVRAIPAAGFFNTFRYDHIGFGCQLKDGVCHMDGIATENGGYVLVEGNGIPAVKVMGYNRSIDWDLLVSRLKAVIAGNTKAVIE